MVVGCRISFSLKVLARTSPEYASRRTEDYAHGVIADSQTPTDSTKLLPPAQGRNHRVVLQDSRDGEHDIWT